MSPEDARRLGLALAVGVLAGVLRLSFISDMEYNYDEKTAYAMAGRFLRLEELPLVGLGSSVGIPNPPGFVVIVAALRGLTHNPLCVGAAIALANAAAIFWLTWFLVPRLGLFIAGAAGMLMATTPWAVIFSRKIWAQDLLAPFGTALLIGLVCAVEERRHRSWILAGSAAFALMQLHLSAVFLIVAIPAAVAAYRLRNGISRPVAPLLLPPVERRVLATVCFVCAVLFAPYVLLILKNSASATACIEASRSPNRSFLTHLHDSWTGFTQICGGTHFETTLLKDAPAYTDFAGTWIIGSAAGASALAIAAFAVGLAWAIRRRKERFVWVYAIVLVLSHLSYILFASTRTGAPYFLILYPAPFLLAALGLSAIPLRWLRHTILCLMVCANVATTLSFELFIRDNGGTASGYGTPYRLQPSHTNAPKQGNM